MTTPFAFALAAFAHHPTSARPFISQALEATQRAGGRVSRSGKITSGSRSHLGRGKRASVQAVHRLKPRSRVAVIKTRVVRHSNRTLYLVVPPSDIARNKPLIRQILNQIGRRLTEDLAGKDRKHRLLLMLGEFTALGRLDFFGSALAFMAGYGIKSFLIAQSLNQIEKAYGPNNSILDNCHVRVSFASKYERTASRVSDALGTATEMRAMKNYAGHRLPP